MKKLTEQQKEEKLKNEFSKLPDEIISTYGITMNSIRLGLYISAPASIMINVDEYFEIKEDRMTWEIINKKVCVDLFSEDKTMYITLI
ncbi:MAG: hypothetical protein GF317_08780 [Candidatus Lokiarchaeota archaeon]|nr:hypothetical protein [Candidatus Lokiarchaeota archaeon]